MSLKTKMVGGGSSLRALPGVSEENKLEGMQITHVTGWRQVLRTGKPTFLGMPLGTFSARISSELLFH